MEWVVNSAFAVIGLVAGAAIAWGKLAGRADSMKDFGEAMRKLETSVAVVSGKDTTAEISELRSTVTENDKTIAVLKERVDNLSKLVAERKETGDERHGRVRKEIDALEKTQHKQAQSIHRVVLEMERVMDEKHPSYPPGTLPNLDEKSV
jgi:hypothetical protein